MHELFVQFKRSYWGIQNTLRKPVNTIVEGMTPARMDLLCALEPLNEIKWRKQRGLARMLGVAKSVVSRMLASMEARGWIRRKKDEHDKRLKLITLTQAGRKAYDSMRETFITSRAVNRCVFHALGGTRWKHRKHTRLGELMVLDERAQQIRDWFRGGGELYYPWHPDDYFSQLLKEFLSQPVVRGTAASCL